MYYLVFKMLVFLPFSLYFAKVQFKPETFQWSFVFFFQLSHRNSQKFNILWIQWKGQMFIHANGQLIFFLCSYQDRSEDSILQALYKEQYQKSCSYALQFSHCSWIQSIWFAYIFTRSSVQWVIHNVKYSRQARNKSVYELLLRSNPSATQK